MAFCPNCGTPMDADATFCPKCGMSAAAMLQPMVPPTDHTAEFDAEDVSQNKVIAMAAYVLGTIGIIIALLAAPGSKYCAFHCRQALKLDIVGILISICTGLLFWTIIVPIVGGVCLIIVFVLRIMCFFNVCKGQAKEPAIISSLGFLK